MITWSDLTAAEPRLAEPEEVVRLEAATAEASPTWSFSIYWSHTLRPAIHPLVGWGRDTGARSELGTEAAWHVATSHLIGLLPAGEGAWAS